MTFRSIIYKVQEHLHLVMKRECKSLSDDHQREDKNSTAGIAVRTDTVCISVPTQEGISETIEEEDPKGKSLHLEIDLKHLLSHHNHLSCNPKC